MSTNAARSVVVDTAKSPRARVKPVPVSAVTLKDGFWSPRLRMNREVTLPTQYQLLEETGRIDNFRAAAGKDPAQYGRSDIDRFVRSGAYYNDSDVYKWLEAASWVLASHRDPELEQMVDTAVTEIEAAQEPDGYLDTYFTGEHRSERWTNLRDLHELYCAGHLIQAAVAHHRATGSEQLLNVACRLADHIDRVFGPQPGQREGTSGHEEIEMALVELTRETGVDRYRRLARFFVEMRGRGYAGGDEYHQDHRPFRAFDRMVGHAVRAVYLNAGAADLCLEGDGEGYLLALDRLWHNMTARQMYVTGGIGARYHGEAFGYDYELPNRRAYAETCAAIGSVMWNWRMLALSGDARHADVLETTLYNGVLVGLSLDGGSYFYQNPLANDGDHRREPWFGCACCPPNIARMLASLPGYVYGVSDDGLWVHLYAEGEATAALPDGRELVVSQRTQYPWDGRIEIQMDTPGTYSLYLRVPAWCEGGAGLRVNEMLFSDELVPGTYAEVRSDWQAGDRVTLDLPMLARRVACHPYVPNNAGRVALMRGPLVYCVEQVDHPDWALDDLAIPFDAPLSADWQPALLGGVCVLRGTAITSPPDPRWSDRLYHSAEPAARPAQGRSVPFTAVPYYAWANREVGAMRVWLPVLRA
jgi:DUF1680 family protein